MVVFNLPGKTFLVFGMADSQFVYRIREADPFSAVIALVKNIDSFQRSMVSQSSILKW
jgi:hypothetical protein